MIPCPNDTNGDGDCGKPLCPHCGGLKSTTGIDKDGREYFINFYEEKTPILYLSKVQSLSDWDYDEDIAYGEPGEDDTEI